MLNVIKKNYTQLATANPFIVRLFDLNSIDSPNQRVNFRLSNNFRSKSFVLIQLY